MPFATPVDKTVATVELLEVQVAELLISTMVPSEYVPEATKA